MGADPRVIPLQTRPGRRLAALSLLLLAACGGGGSGSKSVANHSLVTVTGKVNYEFPEHPPGSCAGLDMDNPTLRPIRGATVQLIDAGSNAVLGTTVSDDVGDYAFANIDANSMVRLRVRAELKQTAGSSRWDVEVRDNYDDGASPPPYASRPLYVVDSADFDTGAASVKVRNMTATTGWDSTSNSYRSDRAAAPFAILDTVYTEMRFIGSVDPNAVFEPLDTFWSVNNTSRVEGDENIGELGGSFFTTDPDKNGTNSPSLMLVGDASYDTDEFDDHLVGHEWGHYFEYSFSRSDSIGGTHWIGDVLDPRVAFGEGWATAFAAMALGDQLYCDTAVPGTSSYFLALGAETGSYVPQGWYDEIAVVRFLYDLFDDNDEGNDSGSLGFAPIYEVMTGPQATTDALTSLFTFATALRAALPASGDQMFVDTQLGRAYTTAAGLDIWASNEQNDAGGQDVLPLYTDFTPADSPLNVCVNSQFEHDFDGIPGPDRDGNKLAESRFLRLTVPTTARYDVTITANPAPPASTDASDPDMYITQAAQLVASGTSEIADAETFRTQNQLVAGTTYVAELEDWRFDDPGADPGYPTRICFDVSFAAAP